MPEAVRLNPAQLRRVFNSARTEPETLTALARVQEAVLAANGLLSEEEVAAVKAAILAGADVTPKRGAR